MRELIEKYLKGKNDMQLATVAEGQPWICTVYFVYDDNFNLYWTSGRTRQHSLEILNDPKAAVTIVKDSERKQALQINGMAYEVADEDLERVHELYQAKYGAKDYDLEDMKRHDSEGRSYWVFKPTEISLWDEVNFPESPKQKYIPGDNSSLNKVGVQK
ncbi:MAG: pyridoxamine 5'-phosphate oxidase family protein [Patescibacteria group bacterium]|nr:pyridoxamine 5'-phosphate oxidase family protein [Patescibacteria group bacterium]